MPRAKLADEDLEYCGYELCSKVARVRCSKCKVVAYCSARCQRLAWVKGHREACGRLPSLGRRTRRAAQATAGFRGAQAALWGT